MIQSVLRRHLYYGTNMMRCKSRLLISVMCVGIVSAAQASGFDPNAGKLAGKTSAKALPSIAPLMQTPRVRSSLVPFPKIDPVDPSLPVAPIVFESAKDAESKTLPPKELPAVSPAENVQAIAPLAESVSEENGVKDVSVAPTQGVAEEIKMEPLPVLSPAPVVSPPAAPAVSLSSTPTLPTEAKPEALSRETKTILSKVPSKIDTPVVPPKQKVVMHQVGTISPDLNAKAGPIDAYEANGIKISVRRPGLDTNYELNRAYSALTAGNSAAAAEAYKNILTAEPKNADALFGLAAIYHRQGLLAKARPLYGKLLKQNPNHREGLNNFLMLMSEESPQEALAELERLEQRNPNFSPIPAQQALILSKLGYADQARSKMARALELAPENQTYIYNLAVMLDTQGNYSEAAELYRVLLQASQRGETIPSTADNIQKRLNFIATEVQKSSQH